MQIRDQLGLNIRELRRFRGLTQEAFAFSAGIDRGYVGSIENSKNAVTVDMLERASAALDVQPFVLLLPRHQKRGWLIDFAKARGGHIDFT
ncbi:MAG: helix-turn-helix transcriptional regulator [Hyphomicrobiales bacterium]|uniref:helix-turn-helix domain-containing protein n=1 Tax=Alphaproteobacteria TaxID=28211 RepID=UPI00326697A1